ncbi:ABC transporter permease [soil metagenome]
MFKNYIKIAWRNLVRSKGYAFINITGLAIGMAGAIIILLWISHEISYDRFHTKQDRLYEAWNQSDFNGTVQSWNWTPKPLGPALQSEYPEVAATSRYSNSESVLFSYNDTRIFQNVTFVDTLFLDMFDFPLEKGDKRRVFNDPSSIILTEKVAKKIFGEEDALGKVISLNNKEYVTVTGILKDPPTNTRFELEAVLPWTFFEKMGYSDDYWGNNSVQTFVKLHSGVNLAEVNLKIRGITRSHSDEDIDVFLHPLEKWHLYSEFENGVVSGGRIDTIKMFALIAVFILLIACINFMNLSTARSGKRAKEVGIRKVSGAKTDMLIIQFISESILLTLFSGIISLLIVQIVLPIFNNLIGQEISIPFGEPFFWILLIVFIVFTGFLAGSYPAFFLSSFQPVKVLKGSFVSIKSALSPRKVLVVLQFTFAIILITCTLIIKQQINHAQNRNLGYQKDQLIYHSLTDDIRKNYNMIREELLQSGAAISVSNTMSPMSQQWSNSWGISWQGKDENSKITISRFSADADLVKTAGLKLVAGRDINIREYPSDSSAMLLNESAMKVMGFDDPIGQIVKDNDRDWQVVGVVEDFIIQSPYQKIAPMVIEGPNAWFGVLHIRLNSENKMSENLTTAETIFKKYNPEYPFEYAFIDQEYAKKFHDQQKTASLTGLFSGLAIFISCLGLFGLAAYMAEQRRKEIGIRKILGASVSKIVGLLSVDFIKLVMIALIIAVPISWLAMDKWLQEYEYKISIEWYVFAVTGLISILIALITVSSQAVKAAISNPVNSLRSE